MRLHGVTARKGNQGFVDRIASPKLARVGQRMFFRDKQNERELEQGPPGDAGAFLSIQNSDRHVDISRLQEALGLGPRGFEELEAEAWKNFAHTPKQLREVVVQ